MFLASKLVILSAANQEGQIVTVKRNEKMWLYRVAIFGAALLTHMKLVCEYLTLNFQVFFHALTNKFPVPAIKLLSSEICLIFALKGIVATSIYITQYSFYLYVTLYRCFSIPPEPVY